MSAHTRDTIFAPISALGNDELRKRTSFLYTYIYICIIILFVIFSYNGIVRSLLTYNVKPSSLHVSN